MTAETNTPTPDVAAVLVTAMAWHGVISDAEAPYDATAAEAAGKAYRALEAAVREACLTYALKMLNKAHPTFVHPKIECGPCSAIADLEALRDT